MSHDEYIFEDPCESMDRSSEEPDPEWERQQKENFGQVYDPEPSKKNPESTQEFKYKFVGRKTPKAKFFVTDTLADTENWVGFWVPKSAIISETMNTVQIADWCEIKEITFT